MLAEVVPFGRVHERIEKQSVDIPMPQITPGTVSARTHGLKGVKARRWIFPAVSRTGAQLGMVKFEVVTDTPCELFSLGLQNCTRFWVLTFRLQESSVVHVPVAMLDRSLVPVVMQRQA